MTLFGRRIEWHRRPRGTWTLAFNSGRMLTLFCIGPIEIWLWRRNPF
jgi:hypothetical protein